MESVYKKSITVQSRDSDFSQRVKLSALFSYFQEMATEHGQILGVGRSSIQKHGVIWVLIRSRVEVERYPKMKEEIFIETWPEQPGKIEFERNFIVRDGEGIIIARALTSWVIIDVENRRLRRSSTLEAKFPDLGREKALTCELGKIQSNNQLKLSYKKAVRYSDIDINEHLNNSKYVDYIMDCFSLDEHKDYQVQSIEVDYVHEALPGETIELYTDMSDAGQNIIYIEGINEKTNMTVFKSQIEIKKL